MTEFMKVLAFVLVSLAISAPTIVTAAPVPVVPTGFKASVLAEVPGARTMALAPNGRIYVGSQDLGKVQMVENGKVQLVVEGLIQPNGVVWHKGDLYIAEISRLTVIRGVDKLKFPLKARDLTVLKDDFPSDLHHGWKYLALGPDNKLYVPVGAPCNICLKPLPYAALHRVGLDGKNLETVAQGIRNTVGFTWHPKTKELYFSDNGRDMMGDNLPFEEINHVTKAGQHFGYPFIHSGVKDPFYFQQMPKGLVTTDPEVKIPAHSAALGIQFTEGPFATAYPGCLMIAEHGSWNRTSKIGYQVSVSCPDKKGVLQDAKPFMTGLLVEGQALGRPVDIKFTPQGAMLVSDDEGGRIWKIEKQK